MKVRPQVAFSSLVFAAVSIVAQAAGVATNGPPSLQPPPGNLLEMLIRIAGAFSVVIAVFVFGAWFFKKSRFLSLYQGGQAQLKVLESRSLGYRTSLVVVGYYQQRFLVAVSNTGVSVLRRLPDAQSAEPEEVKPSAFSEQLNSLQGRKA